MNSAAHQILLDAALTWARADRECDDCAAALDQAAALLARARVKARGTAPEVVGLVIQIDADPDVIDAAAAHDLAKTRFTAACELEHKADETWKELASAMLTYEDVQRDAG